MGFAHRQNQFNAKRRIMGKPSTPEELGVLETLSQRVQYGGNPEHKKNPGDFGLSPPSDPRQGKTLCDDAGVLSKYEALVILRCGVAKGMVSEQKRNSFPQNIWAVTERGEPLEAELENQETGTYHGYPMPQADPFRERVLKRWSE